MCIIIWAILFASKIQGMTGEHSLGGASEHSTIIVSIPTSKRDSALKACMLGRHAFKLGAVKPKILLA